MSKFKDRHLIETEARPEIWRAFGELQRATFATDLPPPLPLEVFTAASRGAGCGHCQAHGAYGLSLGGTPVERIRDLWSFESSEQFSAAERAALRFAFAAARAPSEVTPEHHAGLRTHFSDTQVADILAIVCFAGWLNRWNDSLATVTDQESVDWATKNLTEVGWQVGKHTGDKSEQRAGHPATMERSGRPFFARQD